MHFGRRPRRLCKPARCWRGEPPTIGVALLVAHTVLLHKNSLWYHPDTLKYDLLECTLLFDRFHSQYTHELRDTCAHDPKRDVFGECRMPLGSNPPD